MLTSSKNDNSPSKKKSSQAETSPVAASVTSQDIAENNLRPSRLDEYVGQDAIKSPLKTAIAAAHKRFESIGHVLFYWPPGLGKTTLAQILAHETNATLRRSSGPAIEKVSDLVSMLSTLEEGDILFIDEIHRLRTVVEEVLYTAMEDFTIDIMVGAGTGATAVKMPLPRFTLVGATTRLAGLSNPLRDRFEHILKLDFYDEKDLAKIAQRSFEILGISAPETVTQIVAKRARGTPRIVNRFVKILRDHATLGRDLSKGWVCEEVFGSLGVDARGLDSLDRAYLALLERSAGRPIGLSTIAGTLGEDEATLEDVVEPYLLKCGLIEKTPRGRVVSGGLG